MKVIAALFLLLASCEVGRAEDTANGNVGLRGQLGVHFAIPSAMDALGGYVLSSDLATRCELRLRAGGIPLFTEEEWPKDRAKQARVSILSLIVTASAAFEGFAVHLELEDARMLVAADEKGAFRVIYPTVWSSSRLLVSDKVHIREGINNTTDAMIDVFINDWQATHPKTPVKQ